MKTKDKIAAELFSVLRECNRWSVPVEFGKPNPKIRVWPAFHEGPRFGGIHWPTRTIWFPRFTQREDAPMALLHELSHVLSDIDPEFVDETRSGMLKFECVTARRLGLSWSSWMRDYTVSVPFDIMWSDLTTRERGDILRESHAEAVKDGILDANGRPTYRLPRGLARAIAQFRTSKLRNIGGIYA
jgi:hypothetical protein